MPITNLQDGLASWGIPMTGNAWPVTQPGGQVLFVNGGAGGLANGGSGTLESPYTNMTSAFLAVQSGATIFAKGNVKEQLTTPAGIFNVTIIGTGTQPEYADAHTGTNGYQSFTWRQPATATALTPLLKIQQQGWRLHNFTFAAAVASAPAVDVFRDAGAGDDERDGSRATFTNMLFAGSPLGIRMNGGPANVWILNCHFQDQTTTAIAYTVGAGVGVNLDHWIEGCRFDGNVNNIVMPSTKAVIRNNTFGTPTTKNISLAGGSANYVGPNNIFAVASSYDNDNDPGTSDTWAGNWVIGGVTTANPT